MVGTLRKEQIGLGQLVQRVVADILAPELFEHVKIVLETVPGAYILLWDEHEQCETPPHLASCPCSRRFNLLLGINRRLCPTTIPSNSW